MKPNRAYDYIVIGAGSAGAVVTGRLAEAGQSVLLIEAGPKDRSIYIQMPAALGMALTDKRFNWFYRTAPEPNLDGREIDEARGRVLGGSSAINGMNWVRGNAWDYDNWAAMGCESWGYPEVLPYFKRSESYDKGGNAFRGADGPMKIETSRAENPLYDAFLQAAAQFGLSQTEDHNGQRQEGAHITQRNIHRGVRCSTASAYIAPNAARRNLTIVTEARATKIQISGRRAVGVEYLHRGNRTIAQANREVILCGGALNSPQLLMLSGIGNAKDLRKHEIAVVAHLPAVGSYLKNHVAAPVQYRAVKNVSVARKLGLLGRMFLGANWVLFRRGLGATNFFEVGAFLRTEASLSVPNIQFEFVPLLGEFQHGGVRLQNGFQYFFSLMRPTSSGQVFLRSADPLAAPGFVFNYLGTEVDRRQMIDAIGITREIIAQSAWNRLRGAEVTPGPETGSDAALLLWLRRHAGTNYHPCCSCRMGTGDDSVVDAGGNVHGLDGLRVVDASTMPEIVSGNLNAPVIMMAEKISDAILGRPPLPAEHVPCRDGR